MPRRKPPKKKPRTLYKRVRVFTEEYSIHVFIGNHVDIQTRAQRLLDKACHGAFALQEMGANVRGMAWNTLPEHCPIVGITTGLTMIDSLATLAHEASHAMTFIAGHINLKDDHGEFQAHGISAVVRQVGPLLRRRT